MRFDVILICPGVFPLHQAIRLLLSRRWVGFVFLSKQCMCFSFFRSAVDTPLDSILAAFSLGVRSHSLSGHGEALCLFFLCDSFSSLSSGLFVNCVWCRLFSMLCIGSEGGQELCDSTCVNWQWYRSGTLF